ncbi:hypothetical protein ARMGADRAFT_1163683 [Armillaria gallica]|uniref:Uncharacterized protein n=1 Tax=Armillaria gallica TaxID=47427 RepID=A0A2H3E402_ARMGA|nr:hypothetical protein ARMGADRAFT_1163683 [Armillaria gallica]
METPPPELSQDDKRTIFNKLDMNLNTMVLESLLHGIYTGIVAVTLWTVYTSTKRLHGTFLRTIIIVLYVLLTIAFAMDWAFDCHAIIQHGSSSYSMFMTLEDLEHWGRASRLVDGIIGGISTLLVDVSIIWRCWVLWDRQWRIISLPILCAVAGTIMRTLQIRGVFLNLTDDISKTGNFARNVDWSLMYALLTAATTLTCTLLIVYRIARFAHRLLLFQSIIAALIESSVIYTLALIVYLAPVGRNMLAANYAVIFAAYIRAISPTFLVLRVVARSTPSKERIASTDLSDIHFKTLEENSCDDVGDENIIGSHCRTGTTEIV